MAAMVADEVVAVGRRERVQRIGFTSLRRWPKLSFLMLVVFIAVNLNRACRRWNQISAAVLENEKELR